MLIILKLASFTIWFIIMIFIVGAVLRRKRSSIRAITPYLFYKTENKSKLHSEREKV
jgi:hypothetical protein